MDVTTANIDFTRDAFLSNLALSRLLTQPDYDRFVAQHPHQDAFVLSELLVQAGTLTPFQAEAIMNGKPHEVRIGNYDVLDRIGAGGMGTVFKARHRKMKRIVALKVLSATLCKDESFVQRFQREVETIARLGHPNIVMAYDADEAEIGHFLVMEFVDGRDLNSFVDKNHPIAVGVAIDCILQSARGLAFAHSQGVVHRDIKPGNLLRDIHGIVKVTDLGLARLNTNENNPIETKGITQAGGVLGTVDYMAPEQAVDSTAIDVRADIYSLGATLHFMLTGRPPFSGNTIMAILLKHRDAPIPSLRAIRPDVPEEVDHLFQRMLAKLPEHRPASMTEVVTQMEALLPRLGGHDAQKALLSQYGVASAASSLSINTPEAPTKFAIEGAAPAVSVVVVEASRVQSGIVRKYLEAQGIVVASAVATGADALEAVKQLRPTVIVCSQYLADTTGIELAKQIHAAKCDPMPGFVLISTAAEAGDSSAIEGLPRVVQLHKPFSVEQLIQAVNVVTGKSISVKDTGVSVSGLKPGSSVSLRPPTDRGQVRILIVDDSGTSRIHERIVLQKLGFSQFAEAADGAQAIAAATRERFDLIVTDYNMPLMDGYALVSYLRQTPATAKIPIVMVTTETSDAILDPVRKLGVTAIFDKAFPQDAVQNLMDKLFGK